MITNSRHFIDLTMIHAINRLHDTALQNIVEGEPITTLRELKITQLRRAERELVEAMERLAAKYEAAQTSAILARPNLELAVIMETTGIQSEN